uniref:F-box domain-containing protein n=1 Tax=Panagrolaimus sp. JU765 TaxID=591449 RepID=A0AC34PZT4_9BILA
MTDYFNFLGLPLVVQELITNEIVHNSIPEDRIQLALTSKYCNELVQRARPKKIIDRFSVVEFFSCFIFIADSKKYTKAKEELMEILTNCQIKKILLNDAPETEDDLEIFDMLSEAAKFATKLHIFFPDLDYMDKIVEFYVKMKHLKSVMLWGSDLILPSYPSKVALEFGFGDAPGYFSEDFEEETQNSPLSSFELKCSLTLEKCQQYLQTAEFSIGADISIRYHRMHVPVYLIHLGQNIFTLEMFSNNSCPIFISQKFVGRNRRILKLKRSDFLQPYGKKSPEIAFNVMSASNLDKNYFSGAFKEGQQKMLINLENVDLDEILTVKFVDERIKCRDGNRVTEYYVRPRYSAKMLVSAFPTVNFTTPEERVKTINNVLGTKLQLIQAENFAQIVKVLIQDSSS